MESFNILAGVASIVGLFVSLYTLRKVNALPAAIKTHSRTRRWVDLIDKILGIPEDKLKIIAANTRELMLAVREIRDNPVSKGLRKKPALEKALKELEVELGAEKRREIVQYHLKVLRDELTIG